MISGYRFEEPNKNLVLLFCKTCGLKYVLLSIFNTRAGFDETLSLNAV